MRGAFGAGVLVCVMASAGCYASHQVGAEAGALCEGPGVGGGSPCGALPTSLPHGVCRLADGTIIAFGELDRDASCEPREATEPGEHFVFAPHHCTEERPRGRVVASCGAGNDAPVFHALARPPRVSLAFDLSEASCALARPTDGEPDGPWEPFGVPRALCSDPYAWCGSPMVLEVVHAEPDPSGGDTFTHRCRARVEDDRIVLHAETARQVRGPSSMPAFEDRVARCIVPPLPAGRYEVIDDAERALGSVTVPGLRPVGDLEPTCTPL